MIGTVTAQRLNVRDRLGADGRKLGAIPSGTVVDILDVYREWFEVRFQQAPSFLYGDYIRIEENEWPQTGVGTAGMLNVRDCPSTTGAILGRLVQGSIIEVSSRSEDWIEVSFQDGNGFVSRSYVDLHVRERPHTGSVVAGILNVRARPMADASIVGQFTRGARIEIVATLGSWHEIPFNSGSSLAAAGYVEIDTEVDPSPMPVLLNEAGEEEPPPAAARLDPAEPLILTHMLPMPGNPQERMVSSTWNRFRELLEDLSRRRQLDVAYAVAVLCVESSGKGFEPSNRNRLIIRFENHMLWKYWGRNKPDHYRHHFHYRNGQTWKDSHMAVGARTRLASFSRQSTLGMEGSELRPHDRRRCRTDVHKYGCTADHGLSLPGDRIPIRTEDVSSLQRRHRSPHPGSVRLHVNDYGPPPSGSEFH